MKKYIGLSIIALSLGLTSCNDWLDKLPDNRMLLNNENDSGSGFYCTGYFTASGISYFAYYSRREPAVHTLPP